MKHITKKGKIAAKKWVFRGVKVGIWSLKNTGWHPI